MADGSVHFAPPHIAAARDHASHAYHRLAAIKPPWRTPFDLEAYRYCTRDTPCCKHAVEHSGQWVCVLNRERAEAFEAIGTTFIARLAELLGYATSE